MHYSTKITNLFDHIKLQKLNKISKTKLYSKQASNLIETNFKNMFLWLFKTQIKGICRSVYLHKLKNKNKKKFFKTYSRLSQHLISKPTLFLYIIFFLNFFLNPVNLLYKRNKKAISNNVNSLSSFSEIPEKSLKKHFIKKYYILKNNKKFLFAKPLSQIIVKDKINPNNYIMKKLNNLKLVEIALHFITGMNVTKNKKIYYKKHLSAVRAAYSLNQYILNFFV